MYFCDSTSTPSSVAFGAFAKLVTGVLSLNAVNASMGLSICL